MGERARENARARARARGHERSGGSASQLDP